MRCRFSIIVPTCGRRSLARTLASIADQRLAAGDEVLLVTDGHQPHAAELLTRLGVPGRCIETAPSHDYGGTQRNQGMNEAAGDYLLFMDDDDVYAPDAFASIRAALREAPGLPHLFRMRYASNQRVLWTRRELALGNVSTQMIVCPNRPNLKRWDSMHGHDYRFVVNSLPLWPPDSLVWREEVIAVVRPHECLNGCEVQEASARVAECFYRQEVNNEVGVEIARCLLLEQIGGADAVRWCTVRRDACESCCRSFPPSPAIPNPVIASLLYGLARRMLESGAKESCDFHKAAQLQLWAEDRLGGP
jgi:hypothetical protein